VDGVAFAPHRQVDVRALGADYYLVSLYKVFGPHQGLLYARQERLRELESLNHFFIPETRLAAKLQPGGVNFELVHAAGAIPDYAATLSYDAVARHEAALAERVLSLLRGRRGVRIIGHDRVDAGRLPTVSFTVEGRDAASIPPLFDEFKIGIKYGDFYARRLCDALGVTAKGGVVRISMVHYNTLDEMDRLAACLERTL
jgi:selenocysteine lyase/cysteine desulfurase